MREISARGELERSRKRWSNDDLCLRMLSACAILLFLSTPCFAAQNAAAEDGRRTGTLGGTVSTGTADRLYAGAKVQASGSVTMQTETNGEGKFAFDDLPPGTYTLTANAPGLEAEQIVTLGASQVVQVSLQLKPVRTTTTIDVSAADTAQKTPAPTQTIGGKTLRDAPNVNERFETLLPLVPGVVRGPDGHINLKGARSTQSGALVNSANVTDPATGSPASTCRSMWCRRWTLCRIPTIRSTESSREQSHRSRPRQEIMKNTTTRFRMSFRGGETGRAHRRHRRRHAEGDVYWTAGPGHARVYAVDRVSLSTYTSQQPSSAASGHDARGLQLLYASPT